MSSEKVKEIGYALGVIGNEEVLTGGGMWFPESPYETGQTWARIGSELPKPKEKDFSGSVSVGYSLQPGEEKVVRFVLAWYAPIAIREI